MAMGLLATMSFGCGNSGANGHNEALAGSVCEDLRVWGNDINQAGLHAEPAIAGQPPIVEGQLQASLAGQAADITTTLSDQLTELAGQESGGQPIEPSRYSTERTVPYGRRAYAVHAAPVSATPGELREGL
jgi:hypothetical protein